MRANVGELACNASNGVYRGQIVDVALYRAAGQSEGWVYVVEREGQRSNAPPGNTTIAAVRCRDGQPAATPAAAPVLAPTPKTRPAAKAAPAPVEHPVATEFRRRLVAYEGTLGHFTIDTKTISAEWTSQRCDMIEGEVIDFLLSVNRGYRGKVTQSIVAKRNCGGVRNFRISGARFESYRNGEINDAAILAGLK